MAKFFPTDSTGEIVGGFTTAQKTVLSGYMFSNSPASVGSVTLYWYEGTTDGVSPKAPDASGDVSITIQIKANDSKEFFTDKGALEFPNGVFVKASANTITGGVWVQ